ncbi:hypothetical protein A5646_08780 [Mycobacterium sp. 1245499.0]|nr:hypothetical protein A5646_08780 [Mycobacterium sp. 1245499.0]
MCSGRGAGPQFDTGVYCNPPLCRAKLQGQVVRKCAFRPGDSVVKEGDESPKCLQHQHFTDWSGVTLKRVDELKPGDRIRMKVGHATVVATEPLDDDRTLLTFTYGTKGPADNALTVDVLDDDEWGW